MIEEQAAKRAAAEKTANADKTPPAAPRKVDVGAVAAIGVVITGAISALTLILGYVFGLKAWQYPLVLAGMMLVISGPSMIIVWLELRQRTLGPIPEGNGWAINRRVRINIPFGTALTDVATLPPGSKRSLDDRYEDKEAARKRCQFIAFVVILIFAAALSIRYDRNQRGRYFWQTPPPAPVAPAAPGKQRIGIRSSLG